MSLSITDIESLEQKLQDLQREVDDLRSKNSDLNEHLSAYSLISVGQTSLINKLIDKVPFGVMLLDENFIIIQTNPAAEKIFSEKSSQMKGQHCSHYFKEYEKLNISQALSTNDEIILQTISCLKNKKHVMHNAFVCYEGSQKIIFETFIDISDIKKAEQELIKINKAKDEFLGMISHELKTPLNGILGYCALLEGELRETKNTDVISYVEKIHNAGTHLNQLVSHLLELSNLTAGKVKADNIPIDLDMIVTQLQYRLGKDFEDKGNTLEFTYEDIRPFQQDLALLMKVLYELLVNANKFTDKGKIVMSISLQNKDGENWISFSISDTGCGMAEETINQIFNAFHQEDSSLSRLYSGLGLGLSRVEKIVNIINGHIEIESELHKGSTFTILLPYYPV